MALLLAAVVSTIAACSLVVSLDGLGGGAGPNLVACGVDGYCRLAPPAGWIGPLVESDGPPDAGCGGLFPTPAFGGLNAVADGGAATCACTCSSTGAGGCLYPANVYSTSDCTGTPVAVVATSGCNELAKLAAPMVPKSMKATAGTVVDGGCGATVDASVSNATVSTRHACSGAFERLGCVEERVCVTRQATEVCIARTGDQACPSAYPIKKLRYTTVSDTRGCGACACNVAANVCANVPDYDVHDGPSCGQPASKGSITVTNGCAINPKVTTYNNMILTPLPKASCTVVQAPAPTGSVTGSDPLTFCCSP